jgi:hypothetical protein
MAEAVSPEDGTRGSMLADLKKILQPLPFKPTLEALVGYILNEKNHSYLVGFWDGYAEGRADADLHLPVP